MIASVCANEKYATKMLCVYGRKIIKIILIFGIIWILIIKGRMDIKEIGINTRNWVDSDQDRDY